MPESSISPDPVLLRESLTIKKIICFASGESWPPTDEFWLGIQADLKDACSLGELRYSTPDNNPHRAYYNIRLLELWPFLVKKDQRWQPLRDFCRRWADARGVTLPPEHTEQADGLTSPSSSPPNLTDKSRSDGGEGGEPRSPGRPSLEAQIRDAYLALERDKEVDCAGYQTALYEPIREKVRTALGDPTLYKGLGKETIRKTIQPLFEASKAKQQSAST